MKRSDACARHYTRLVQYLASSGASQLPPTVSVRRLARWLCTRPNNIMANRDVAALLLWAALNYERNQRKSKPKP